MDDKNFPKGATELEDKRRGYFQYFKKSKLQKGEYTEEKLPITGYTMSWTARLKASTVGHLGHHAR